MKIVAGMFLAFFSDSAIIETVILQDLEFVFLIQLKINYFLLLKNKNVPNLFWDLLHLCHCFRGWKLLLWNWKSDKVFESTDQSRLQSQKLWVGGSFFGWITTVFLWFQWVGIVVSHTMSAMEPRRGITAFRPRRGITAFRGMNLFRCVMQPSTNAFWIPIRMEENANPWFTSPMENSHNYLINFVSSLATLSAIEALINVLKFTNLQHCENLSLFFMCVCSPSVKSISHFIKLIHNKIIIIINSNFSMSPRTLGHCNSGGAQSVLGSRTQPSGTPITKT